MILNANLNNAIVEVSEKIDGSKEEIVTEISSLRDDLRSYMEEKFARLEVYKRRDYGSGSSGS
jgi:hypothetical protein